MHLPNFLILAQNIGHSEMNTKIIFEQLQPILLQGYQKKSLSYSEGEDLAKTI